MAEYGELEMWGEELGTVILTIGGTGKDGAL